jgi:hypothetical protein
VSENDNINVVQVAGCGSWGSIAHEIGHVLGRGHEQSRKDRDEFIEMRWGNIKKGKEPNYCKVWNQQLEKTIYDFDSIMHYPVDGFAKDKSDYPPCKEEEYNGKLRCLAFRPYRDKKRQQEQEIGRPIMVGQTDHLSKRDIAAIDMLYPGPPPPGSAEPCTITTTTVVRVGDQTTTKTRTEPCPPPIITKPPPDRDRCCDVQRPHRPLCRPDTCRPVRVSWPRPDRWCQPGWCRPWPRARRLCDRDGWIEDRPPFDDWDG